MAPPFIPISSFCGCLQRVAASVKMVAKGVLREHLILLASSMTCGGNLVGFNTGGYKALSRQLNIQVPFTDATLFVSCCLLLVVIMRCIRLLLFLLCKCDYADT